MGLKAVSKKSKTLYGHLLLMAFLALTLNGCGAPLFNSSNDETTSVIWKHRDQYVRVEPQDRGTTKTLPNDHPANFPAEELMNMFLSLNVHFEGDENPVSLFTFREMEILAPAISQGLAEAGPREDVTFAIVGIHRGLISFSHDRAVITGRVFVQNGNLNLIIGRLHQEYVGDEDRRIDPLLPGSRKESTPLPKWGKPWEIVPMTGLKTETVAGVNRHDWLMMSPDPQIWKIAITEKKEAAETAKAAFREASQVREESAQLEAEQQQLRAEIQEMKRTIEQMKQGSTTVAPAPVPAAAAPATVTAPAPATRAPAAPAAPADLTKIEQRLDILKRLKAKGLISNEEYQAKKQEILDSL